VKNDNKSSVYEQLELIYKEMQECDKRIKVLLNSSRGQLTGITWLTTNALEKSMRNTTLEFRSV